MDQGAARRARQKRIKADLAEAYTDEEASPPEWVDILTEVKEATASLEAEISRETERFTTDPDVKAALDRRERVANNALRRIDELNAKIKRLNLIAPNARFTRPAIDADRLLRPLFRSERRPDAT